jgi:O-glycosyl hydrolase
MWILNRKLNTLFLCALVLFLHSLSSNSYAQTATISAGTVNQTIDGFGGPNGGVPSWDPGNTQANAQTDMLFSQSSGIGLTIYRTNSPDGTTFPDLAVMQRAVADGAQIELSLSGPPDAMHYSGSFTDGTAGSSGSCVSVSYATYAAYVVSLIQALAANGVPVNYLEVQTEPNTQNNTFGACIFSASALDTFVQALGPALSAAGYSPKLSLGAAYPYANSPSYFDTCINDASCAPYISIVSGHGYGYPDSPVLYGVSGRHNWMSETSPNEDSCFNATMIDESGCTGALTMAQNVDAFLYTGQVSNYQWWELTYLNNGGDCENCDLLDQNGDTTKRYYAFGNWSKFVRPGQVEIGSTHNPQSGVTVTAFENQSTGAFEIVAVNTNGSSVSQTFTLTGLSSGSVTPYITDPNNNLAAESAITISGNSFSATLTGSSVTTFISAGGNSGSPSHLTATMVQ